MTAHDWQRVVLAGLLTLHFGGLIATIAASWIRDNRTARREHHA